MTYVRKTRDRWDIETFQGQSWKYECSEYTRAEAIQRLKEYHENCNCGVRIKKRRERV